MWLRFLPPSGAALVLAVWLAAGPVAHADIQDKKQRHQVAEPALRNAPPNGVEQIVQLEAGARTEIILESHGQVGKTIEFILRDAPAHGTLLDPHPATRNTYSVTYAPDPGSEATSDSFTYAVKARGTVISSVATVSIEIAPLPARMVAGPAELDFGAVNVGEVSRAQITAENQGGGTAIGQIMPPPPWVVDGSAEYRLGHGEKQTFQLIFRPAAGRVFNDELVLGSGPGQRVHLAGTGLGGPQALASADSNAGAAGTALAGNGSGAAAGTGSRGAGGGQGGANGGGGSGSTGGARGGVSGVTGSNGANGGAAVASRGTGGAAPADNGRVNSGPGDQSTDPAFLNDAKVETIALRWRDTRILKIGWKPPRPTPDGYRVELRYLWLDEDKKLQIDWRPYSRVDFAVEGSEVTATLRGLPVGTRQTMRVLAFDKRGNLAAPSANLQATTLPGSDWWKPTPFRVLLLALAVCLYLLWQRRRNQYELIREIRATPVPSYRA